MVSDAACEDMREVKTCSKLGTLPGGYNNDIGCSPGWLGTIKYKPLYIDLLCDSCLGGTSSSGMLLVALCLLAALCCGTGVSAQCGSDNSTATNTSTGSNSNVTCAESRATSVPCAGGNCTPPADSTSRLLPGVTVPSNNDTFDKPLSTTAQFSPSPFLGVIPERPGSLVIGEVFQDTVAPQVNPRQKTLVFPSKRPVQEYAHPRDSYQREYQRPSVEIQIGTDYDRPEYDTSGRPYGSPDVDLTVPTGYGNPEGLAPKPEGGRPNTDGAVGGAYPNHVQYSGYLDGKPKQPYYEGYENIKNLLKPVKSPPPYQFEPSFGAEKPIQEDNGEANHYSLAYPPVAAADGTPASYNKYLAEHGKYYGDKWKSVLRFVATVLPFGLLLAALSPNILVISPADESEGTNKQHGHRSLRHGSLGPCGLRRLCEALSTSPQDFEVFLKAAKQGSTPELKDIIKKAEEKNCSSLGCLELNPTQPTLK